MKNTLENTGSYLYPCFVTIDGNTCFLIWYCDESGNDRFLMKDGNDLLVAHSKEDMDTQLAERACTIKWDEQADYNFDLLLPVLESVADTHKSNDEQNKLCLDFWNFFEDMMRTFGIDEDFSHFRNPLLDKAYDKLFWGCNLPSVTPKGKSYTPLWSDEEIKEMQEFMTKAKEVFIPKIALQ